ncbi:MAG: Two-component sensor kinase [Candidatus Daviesbacteria bacterium GW2011_GWA1_38_7]|nr:MAG: Two-component sensor kinase [Candidatus Daviesbacteria bacterium GW2011_GWA1_38_7]
MKGKHRTASLKLNPLKFLDKLSLSFNDSKPAQLNGLITTIVTLIIIHFFIVENIELIYPSNIFQLLVVYSAIVGGTFSGLNSAGIIFLYSAFVLSVPNQIFNYTAESFQRLILVSSTSVLTALLVGYLKRLLVISLKKQTKAENLQEITKALSKSERQYRLLFEQNPQPMFVIEKNSLSFLAVNQAAARFYGYSKEEFLRMSLREIRPPEDVPKLLQYYAKMKISSGSGVQPAGTWRHLKKDGGLVYVETAWGPIHFEGEQAVLIAISDVTSRHELEERKNEFISIASHELKTPLTTIKGYVQILENYSKDFSDQRVIGYINRVNQQVDRLNNLVSDLLNVSRIQSGKFEIQKEVFNFSELATNIAKDFQQMTPEHQFECIIEPKVQVKGDEFRLSQVISNLLSNAAKYSPANTKIIVRLSRLRKRALLEVQDFGIGIAKKYQDKIFDSFFRVGVGNHQAQAGNLGLGLYITSQIVKKHKGRIWVESEERKGSTFYVSLPSVV